MIGRCGLENDTFVQDTYRTAIIARNIHVIIIIDTHTRDERRIELFVV
jgi:hypothetical protein